MSKKFFPKKFHWGAATASYQIEGGIDNNDWSMASKDGKVPACDRATDHYSRYKEDIDLAKSLGHNSIRISIEWSRIEPEEGKFDEKEIEHYKDVLSYIISKDMTPFVTIWHFTLPVWFRDIGGFLNKKSPGYFARYCEYVVSELGNLCRHWATINEPVVFATNGYIRGFWPPFEKSFRSYNRVFNNLVKAHKLSYKRIKSLDIGCELGIVKDNIYFHSNWNPFNKILAGVMSWWWNRRFLNKIHGYFDSIGLNYYFHKKFGDNSIYEKTDMDWDIYPEGIYYVIRELKQYDKPIFIAEAGIADEKDKYRGDYIKDLISNTHKAIEHGANVRGFMYWSLLDNYEWAHGFEKRFGLIEVDYKTLKRKIRPSAYEYKKICQSNSIEG
ncbi:MAG: glycoside hydrolase family 1 protein [Candidatus Pacebacteria bacterium]|nr:glycoside hydrolase family 1 protein [Candidatus Paceibacterota bacterium]